MKRRDLEDTAAIPVKILGNGEVFSFRVDPSSEWSMRASRLRKFRDTLIAVFDSEAEADKHESFFPGCRRITYGQPRDAFDLTLKENRE